MAGSNFGSSTTGDGGAATAASLNGPAGVSLTADGGYLIADSGNYRIRRVEAGVFDVAPELSAVSLSERRFRARVGSTLRYRLSEPVAVRLTIARRSAGRLVGGKCLRPKRSNRTRPRCTRKVNVGSVNKAGKSGDNTTKLSGRLRGRLLAPGAYRLTLVAIDAAGNRSTSKRLSFTILRPPSPIR